MIRAWLPIIGLLALAIVIWLGGPLIGIGPFRPLAGAVARLVAILLMVSVWGVLQYRKKIQNQKVAQELAGGGEAPAATQAPEADRGGEERDTLDKGFAEALKVLGKTRFSDNRGLYQLPWYVIIGPPGAGKTTALVNSGLHFPLADTFGRQGVKGTGGTRDCDWWFTDQAVLIDTAGRYTTQDSDSEVDSAGWTGFLDLLKKHRRRQPLNGVLVAISIADLITQSEPERRQQAAAVKRRVRELVDRLGVNFPVYVLFTKSDLVAGFVEYFDDLGQDARSQVWGVTFPPSDRDAPQGVAGFPSAYDALMERLGDRLMSRLHQERDPGRRAAIHGFPQQAAGLKPVLSAFVDEVFTPSRFEKPFYLRGVYFTSGTQEGTPIDRLMGTLAATFGLDRRSAPAFSGQGRSYFLGGLFRDVIFREAHLAAADPRVERQQLWLTRAAYGATAAAAVGAVVVWSTSYSRNVGLIHAMEGHVKAYQQRAANLRPGASARDVLPALNSLADAAHTYDNAGLLWLTGLGLSKRGTLEPAAREAYVAVLQADYLPLLRRRIEAQMRAGSDNTELLQASLKAYLMLGDPKRLDPAFMKVWMALDWRAAFPGEDDAQSRLAAHGDALLAAGPAPVALDDRLVERTRRALLQVPLDQRVYGAIKEEALARPELAFRLDEAVAPSGRGVFEPRTDGGPAHHNVALFTYAGFHDFFLPEAPRILKDSTRENWILGEGAAEGAVNDERTQRQVARLYADDFVRTWQSMLGDMGVVHFRDVDHGLEVLGKLAGGASPLRTVLDVVRDQTTLERDSATDKAAAAAEGGLSQITGKLGRLSRALQQAAEEAPEGSSESPGAPIQAALLPIAQLAQGDAKAPAPIDDVIGQIGEVQAYLETAVSGGPGSALKAAAARMGGGRDPIATLRAKATRLPDPVKSWVQDVADETWRVLLTAAKADVDKAWRAEVLPEFDRAVKGRYPVASRAQGEVTLTDFAAFFGPGGVLDGFYRDYIDPFTESTRRGLRLKTYEGRQLPLSADGLKTFDQALGVRESYFSGGDQALVRFSLKPEDLDADVSRFTLNLDGQEVSYRHGPAQSRQVVWPGSAGVSKAWILFESSDGGQHRASEDGPWAWFHLLDRAKVRRKSQRDRVAVTFSVEGHSARYELQASSVTNPFAGGSVKGFELPRTL